jgi:hypothetical protein
MLDETATPCIPVLQQHPLTLGTYLVIYPAISGRDQDPAPAPGPHAHHCRGGCCRQ